MAMKDKNGQFNTALLDYVRQGSVELMQSLLRNDNPDLIDQEGKTLLHYAAESNNVSMTQHFINNNQNVDIVDNQGNSPLMLAAKKRSYDTVILLVKAGANIYSCSDEAARILLDEARFKSGYLVSNKYHEYVKTILQKLRKDCCNDEQLLLARLCHFDCSLVQVMSLGDVNVTRLMLENGYLVDERKLPAYETALHRAVYFGDVKNVKVLLEFGASVHASDLNKCPPLYHLFKRQSDSREDEEERVDIMKILIEHGALSGKAPHDPIHYILERSGLRAITALMQYGIDINYHAALSSLVENPNDDVLEVVRGKNIDVNDHGGFSLISNAVCNGRLRKVQFLLEHGADPNVVDEDDLETPLLSAFIYLGSNLPKSLLPIVQLLLQYGADAQYFMDDEHQEQETVFDINNTSPLRQQALESVVAHLALTEDCGVTISELIRGKIGSQDIYKQHFQVCKEQIEEMKKTTVNGSITLYKLLTESQLKISRYAHDPEFTAKFEEAMKDKRFLDPYYSISLQKRVEKAIHEARLREKAVVVMNKILPCCLRNCTDVFVEILDYLTCDDLKEICKVYDPTSSNLPT